MKQVISLLCRDQSLVLEKGCHGSMIVNGLLKYKWPHE